MQIGELLEVADIEGFRRWLADNHQLKKEIWLVLYKKSSGRQTISYVGAVEQALCYGWVDSLMKSLDAERYAQRFSPRRPNSRWTETNRTLARRLIAEGRMTPAGMVALPPDFLIVKAGESDVNR